MLPGSPAASSARPSCAPNTSLDADDVFKGLGHPILATFEGERAFLGSGAKRGLVVGFEQNTRTPGIKNGIFSI